MKPYSKVLPKHKMVAYSVKFNCSHSSPMSNKCGQYFFPH